VEEPTYERGNTVVPEQMTILTTSNCTARCAHCLVRAGPERSDTLSYPDIAGVV